MAIREGAQVLDGLKAAEKLAARSGSSAIFSVPQDKVLQIQRAIDLERAGDSTAGSTLFALRKELGGAKFDGVYDTLSDGNLRVIDDVEAAKIKGRGVPLELEKLAPGDTAFASKLKALKIPPQDTQRIIKSLEKTGGGQVIADYIKSGMFDGVEGYKEVILASKRKDELSSIYQTLQKGEELIAQDKKIVFERTSTEPKFDIDVGVVDADGNLSEAIQLKYVKSYKKIADNANKAASQLVDAPGNNKLVQIKVAQGSYSDFVNSGKESTFIRNTMNFSNINFKIEFSDGTTKVY